MMDEGVAVIAAARPKLRSNDTEYPYRQNSDFYYLCGLEEDNAALVFVKSATAHKTLLFVQSKNEKLELWTGVRLGVDAAREQFAVDEVHSIDTYRERIKELLKDHHTLYLELFCDDPLYARAKSTAEALMQSRGVQRSPQTFKDITTLTQKMRLIKDESEIALIKKALEITKTAHHHAMKVCTPQMKEYQIQAEYEYIFTKNGAYSDAYTTIVAGGNNANTLHYIKNDHPLREGEMVLIDAGCEYEMYASDITRTFPVSGRFTPQQKALYEMVLGVQLRVIESIKPGVTKTRLQELSERLLCEGMVKVGILSGEIDALLEKKAHKKYFPHGIGHWMGLDVHDPCPYTDEEGNDIAFAPGMVMTIEPGLYLREDDESLPEQFRGIGIRIEDNILVTEAGCENLSEGIAKSVGEIEAMCRAE
jgi:Xaa-Pro aminopeptidase